MQMIRLLRVQAMMFAASVSVAAGCVLVMGTDYLSAVSLALLIRWVDHAF
jgi:hypothetical protein